MDTATTADYMYAATCSAIFIFVMLSLFIIIYLTPWDEVSEFFTRWYVYLFVRISHRAKCPACGSRRKHPIVFSLAHKAEGANEAGAILHQCVDCQAAFAERTLIDPGKWLIKQPPAQTGDPAPNSFMQSFGGASREPISPSGTTTTTTVMRDQTTPTVLG